MEQFTFIPKDHQAARSRRLQLSEKYTLWLFPTFAIILASLFIVGLYSIQLFTFQNSIDQLSSSNEAFGAAQKDILPEDKHIDVFLASLGELSTKKVEISVILAGLEPYYDPSLVIQSTAYTKLDKKLTLQGSINNVEAATRQVEKMKTNKDVATVDFENVKTNENNSVGFTLLITLK